MANANLHAAKAAKNDEFYTQRSDIEKELRHYWPHFNGKTIYLNCDSERSEFWDYFSGGFEFFNLKKLIATHYSEEGAYKLVMENHGSYTKEYLSGSGDFRSDECVEILKEADIVVTNPPFSLFRDFIDLMVECEKDFIVIGNQNAITYKNVFPLIMNNKLWLGTSLAKTFTTPTGDIQRFGNIGWFTTLDHYKRNFALPLSAVYSPSKYPMYDNYAAIEVSRTSDIPVDFDGVMGVPITFLNKYNPEQFEIIGSSESGGNTLPGVEEIRTSEKRSSPFLNGKGLFKRIFIRAK